MPVALIDRNPRNPRRDFRAEDLDELAASVRQHGIVQPIVVRPVAGAEERYEIIAGERRWRAAQLAGLHEVPVAILDVSDREALELAIVENVQRADLNPVEEARGYQALMDEFGYSQGDLGTTIGKSRVHVNNTLRLLKLPPSLLALSGGRHAIGRARAGAAFRARSGAAGASGRRQRTFRSARRSGWRSCPTRSRAPSLSRKADEERGSAGRGEGACRPARARGRPSARR